MLKYCYAVSLHLMPFLVLYKQPAAAATQSSAAPPQSEASDTAPGTAAPQSEAPGTRTFLRPPPSLSMVSI